MSGGRLEEKKKTSSGFHFVAGLGSGVASAFLLQPADLLKTRVQQAEASTLRHAFRDVLNAPHPVRALWRGTTPSVIRTGIGSALYFGMLNQMRQAIARMSHATPSSPSSSSSSSSSALPKLSNLANLSTGALARVAAGFVLNPVAVLKVRYESTQYAYNSLAGAARDVVSREGFRGFFAGAGATAVRDAPYAGLYVLVYEQAKTRLVTTTSTTTTTTTAKASGASSATVNFMSGVIAAVSATTITNPFDAIKTRLQLAPGRYRNMLQAARTMFREEGVRSMFSGLSLRIGRKALSSALTWTVYEELIRRAEAKLV